MRSTRKRKIEPGETFGSWRVAGLASVSIHGSVTYACVCDCGTSRNVVGHSLLCGRTKSCGCSKPEAAERRLKRILLESVEHKTWRRIRSDRTRRICKSWLSFEQFYKDLFPRRRLRKLALISDTCGYYPWNVRWSSNWSTPQLTEHQTRRAIKLLAAGDSVSAIVERLSIRRGPVARLKTRFGFRYASKFRGHNITEKEFDQRLRAQDYKCGICRLKLSRATAQTDHCHRTDVVRGLLCVKCNTGIGHFDDGTPLLFAAVRYLDKFRAEQAFSAAKMAA